MHACFPPRWPVEDRQPSGCAPTFARGHFSTLNMDNVWMKVLHQMLQLF